MSSEAQPPEFSGLQPVPPAPDRDPVNDLRRAAEEVMSIVDVTRGSGIAYLRIRGKLTLPSEEAFRRLRPQFEALGFTPRLRREENQEVIYAMTGVFGRRRSGPPRLALILLVLTILSVFFVGLYHSDSLWIDPLMVLIVQITGSVNSVARMYPILAEHPELLPTPAQWQDTLLTGLMFAASLLGILGAHEMGHYLMARYHKVHTTLPFFIPLPLPPLGTMGAVIAMREPAPNRRIQFDIGVAGPIAGLVVAIPVLIWGLTLSEVHTRSAIIASAPEAIREDIAFSQEGNSILHLAIKYAIFGEILPRGDRDVFVHAVAFAGWAGLLVTALNLLPVGQLDGGHVMFGLFGEKAGRLRVPVLIVLLALAGGGVLKEMTGIDLGFGWSGWFLWAMMIYFLLRSHAPVLDEITGLDTKRRVLGIVMLIVFVLIFIPTPLVFDAPQIGR